MNTTDERIRAQTLERTHSNECQSQYQRGFLSKSFSSQLYLLKKKPNKIYTLAGLNRWLTDEIFILSKLTCSFRSKLEFGNDTISIRNHFYRKSAQNTVAWIQWISGFVGLGYVPKIFTVSLSFCVLYILVIDFLNRDTKYFGKGALANGAPKELIWIGNFD